MNKVHYFLPLFLQKVGFIVFYFLHKFFVNLEIVGHENLLEVERPIIFAANHTSELDVTAAPLALGFFSKFYPIYFVSGPKDKFNSFGWRNYIYGGIFFNVLGGYPIHSGFKDYETSLETFIDLLDSKQTIFIFPEGGRTQDGKIRPERGGLGFLVYETDATVVPIVINTFFDISAKKYFLRKRKVKIEILKPIFSKDFSRVEEPSVEDYREVSRIVLKRIEEALN